MRGEAIRRDVFIRHADLFCFDGDRDKLESAAPGTLNGVVVSVVLFGIKRHKSAKLEFF